MDGWTQGDVTSGKTRIHYYRAGDVGAPAIVLLHGVTDSGLCWSRVAHELEDEYDVVMPDARGHGTSDPVGDSLSIETQAADAAAVIHALRLDRPVLWGHSMGGLTAMVLAARQPDTVRGVVLEDPPIGDGLPGFEFQPEMLEEIARERAVPREVRLQAAFREQPNWTADEIVPWSDSKVQYDTALLQRGSIFREVPWRDVLARIECPVLLLTGDPERGAIVTPAVAADASGLWRDGRVARIEGAGHCVHRDRYRAVMQQVREFLEASCA